MFNVRYSYYNKVFCNVIARNTPKIKGLLYLEIQITDDHGNTDFWGGEGQGIRVPEWETEGKIGESKIKLSARLTSEEHFETVTKEVYKKEGRIFLLDRMIVRLLEDLLKDVTKNLSDKSIAVSYGKDLDDLVNQSVRDFTLRMGLPDPPVMTLISSMFYEKEQCTGKMIFADGWEPQQEKSIVFEKGIPFDAQSCRSIRKVLQMTGEERYAVYDFWEAEIKGLQEGTDGLESGFTLEFIGHMHWKLSSQDKEILQYKDGVYHILDDLDSMEENYRHLEEFCQDTQKREQVLSIIEEARKQRKGTMIVISSNASEETKRLCDNNRGIRIEPPKPEENKKWILPFSSIDGAVFLDEDLRCLAIGVLLDGPSAMGKTERGARYNSALSYIKWRRDKKGEKVLAIVISEDGMVNVIV